MDRQVDVDVVVIGSGAGGMAAAVALAQAGQKVVVFEQHYLPGGWCHSFTLEGYRFSPGVHYIGELGPGGRMRAIYEGLGLGGDLVFYQLNPDGFDHILVAGERFDICKGRDRLVARLGDRFPHERPGIRRYFETCQRLSDELGALMDIRGVRDVLALPFRAPTVARWGLRTARALIDAHVEDPLLRAVLAGQSGDHGLPPSRASAAVHASVVGHYFDGGWYPRGGAYTIPRAFIRALRRAGGELHVRTEVAEIVVAGGRAAGVRLADGTEVRARHVVSNADPEVTYRRLIAPAHVPPAVRRKLRRSRWSCSALSLFMAADLDARAAGLDSGNYWYYPHADVEGIYQMGLKGWRDVDELPGLFLTCTSLKDPGKRRKGHHTFEAFTFVGWDAYREWEQSRLGDRPDDYTRLKERLLDQMLDTADRVAPGLRDAVVFAELGTPLTNVHYCASSRGNLYGTEKSRFQVGPWSWPVRGAIDGLWLCGASTVAHGVLGATLSGLMAARGILGCRTADLLRPGGRPVTLLQAEAAPPPRVHATA